MNNFTYLHMDDTGDRVSLEATKSSPSGVLTIKGKGNGMCVFLPTDASGAELFLHSLITQAQALYGKLAPPAVAVSNDQP